MRYDFGSDNTAGMAPSAVEGLVRANEGFARAYGADDVTARAAEAYAASVADQPPIETLINPPATSQ